MDHSLKVVLHCNWESRVVCGVFTGQAAEDTWVRGQTMILKPPSRVLPLKGPGVQNISLRGDIQIQLRKAHPSLGLCRRYRGSNLGELLLLSSLLLLRDRVSLCSPETELYRPSWPGAQEICLTLPPECYHTRLASEFLTSKLVDMLP